MPTPKTRIVGMQHSRLLALTALRTAAPNAKVAATRAAWLQAASAPMTISAVRAAGDDAGVPGRLEQPVLVPAMSMPRRSPFPTEGRAALIHSICHIEYNAINLALDAVWRFDGMPEAYYRDWLLVANEEALHFTLLQDHLREMGWEYGDFSAHDGLWSMCDKTKGDILARMALVPRTLEARGLDATPLVQTKLRRVNTPDALRAVEILDIILRDEIGHVAIGNHWYRWLCARDGLDPVAHYRKLYRQYQAPRLRPPYNLEARARAGFTEQELGELGELWGLQ